MPFIGRSDYVTCLDHLSTLDDAARLSLQKNKDGGHDIVATKGTLADQFYFVWATFFPKTAAEARRATLEKIKTDIARTYGSEAVERFDEEFLRSTAKATWAPLVVRELKNFASNEIATAMLFKNQFKIPTQADQKIQSNNDDVTQLSRTLQSSHKLNDPSQKAKADKIFNAGLKKLSSQSMGQQYKSPTPDELETYSKLVELEVDFEQKTLPRLVFSGSEKCIDKMSLKEKRQMFRRDLENFLDQRPCISVTQFEDYLKNYSLRFNPEKIKEEKSQSINEDPLDLKEGTATSTSVMEDNPTLAQELVSLVASGNQPSQVFDFLAKMYDKKNPIIENGEKVSDWTKRFFVRAVFDNLTIYSRLNERVQKFVGDNPRTFNLAMDMVCFLAEPEKISSSLKIYNQELKKF